MPIFSLIILSGLAALMSSIFGIAGGVFLLAGLSMIAAPASIIPMHAAVQTFGGIVRLAVFRRHLNFKIIKYFYIWMFLGAIIGSILLYIIHSINPSFLLIIIGLFIVYSSVSIGRSNRKIAIRKISTLGIICGALGLFVGSTGPMVSIWLLDNGVVKEEHIACKSAIGIGLHALKIPIFIFLLDFDFSLYIIPILIMCSSVLVFSVVGKSIIKKFDDSKFIIIVKLLLFAIGINIIMKELLGLL
tara:strand:- start:18179 stop:18913 length:735 start_codon:yes stop_codon:yes gene_type:complete